MLNARLFDWVMCKIPLPQQIIYLRTLSLCSRMIPNHERTFYATCLFIFIFCAVRCSGCGIATPCHYGESEEQLVEFLLSFPFSEDMDCSSIHCQAREVSVLLSHQPEGCSEAVLSSWHQLQSNCAKAVDGTCCPQCTQVSNMHCDDAYSSNDTTFASLYTGVVAVLLVFNLVGTS